MLSRIKFWLLGWRNQPFWYNDGSGLHVAFQSYNPFTDQVTVRNGRFGTSPLGHYPKMSREEWLAYADKPGWRNTRGGYSKEEAFL